MSASAVGSKLDTFGDGDARLDELEKTIQLGFQTFIGVGEALAEIRDSRLYRADFGCFEDYLEQRWNWKRRTGYQYIEAAKVARHVQSTAQLGFTQAAELAALSPTAQRQLAKTVEGLTARATRRVVNEYKRTEQRDQEREREKELASAAAQARRTSPPREPYEPNTPRKKQLAEAQKRRLELCLSKIETYSEGLIGSIDLRKAVAVMTAEEIETWAKIATEASVLLARFNNLLSKERRS